MSVLEMQRAFCRILTDENSRKLFLSNRSRFLTDYQLNSAERRALEEIDEERVIVYANLLINSRIDLALKALPHVRAHLPSDFQQIYGLRYVQDYPSILTTTEPPLLREFRQFTEFLNVLLEEGEFSSGSFKDSLRYDWIIFFLGNDLSTHSALTEFERDSLVGERVVVSADSVVICSPGIVLESFEHGLIGRSAEDTAQETEQSPSRHILFVKRRSLSNVSVYRLNFATFRFLQHCDGRRTVAEIANSLVGVGGTAPISKCLGICRSFLRIGVLGVVPHGRGDGTMRD